MANRPGSIHGDNLDTGIYPTDAFEFTKPGATTPLVAVRDGWKFGSDTALTAGEIGDADEIILWHAASGSYRKIAFSTLVTALTP